ncbi:DUF6875 domain-containing protein [Nocardia callitridis]|uniref:DUF6875 domain-containing protein n=1 Tax=Nocardia callitridis TaxID=648753 RepID=A0ABP9JQV0_9NOCA
MSARRGVRTGIEWRDIYDDPADWASRHHCAEALDTYFRAQLTAPDPNLGRDGPVCPFVRRAITEHTLWASVVPGEPTADAMAEAVDDAVEVYREVDAGAERPRIMAVVTVFPDLTGYESIDAAHLARKSGVVERGLMLGQFYPGCAVSGLWNRDFHPLDAPLPMLVIRKMMSTDFPFLAARSEWLYAYFSTVAPDLPRRLRRSMSELLRVDATAADAVTDLRQHSSGEHAR